MCERTRVLQDLETMVEQCPGLRQYRVSLVWDSEANMDCGWLVTGTDVRWGDADRFQLRAFNQRSGGGEVSKLQTVEEGEKLPSQTEGVDKTAKELDRKEIALDVLRSKVETLNGLNGENIEKFNAKIKTLQKELDTKYEEVEEQKKIASEDKIKNKSLQSKLVIQVEKLKVELGIATVNTEELENKLETKCEVKLWSKTIAQRIESKDMSNKIKNLKKSTQKNVQLFRQHKKQVIEIVKKMAEHTEQDKTIQKEVMGGETNQNKLLVERSKGEAEASENTEESYIVVVNDNMIAFSKDLFNSSKRSLGKKQDVPIKTVTRKSAQRVRNLNKVELVYPRAMEKIRDLTKLKCVLVQDDKKGIKEDGLEMKRKNLIKLRNLNVKKLQKGIEQKQEH
jgi:hypothetical protein